MRAGPWTPRLAAPDAVVDHSAQVRWPRLPPPTQAVQLLPSGSRFQTHWFLHHRSKSSQESTREPFFSYPAGTFLHAPGRQLLRSLHKGGTCSASRNRLCGSTSDFVHSSSEASAQGGYLWRLPMPLIHGQTSTATTLYSSIVVHSVQSLYISHYVYGNKPVLS
jgi:hypothetical protein